VKHLLTTIAVLLMVGCVKDDISLYNNGQKDWEDIEILAGGKVHKIKRLNGGAKKNLLNLGKES